MVAVVVSPQGSMTSSVIMCFPQVFLQQFQSFCQKLKPFELIVQMDRFGSTFILQHMCIQHSWSHWLIVLSFYQCMFVNFVENQ